MLRKRFYRSVITITLLMQREYNVDHDNLNKLSLMSVENLIDFLPDDILTMILSKQHTMDTFDTSLDTMEYLTNYLKGKNIDIILELVNNQDIMTLEKYLNCCNISHELYCSNCMDVKKVPYHCGLRFCEFCSKKRFFMLRDKYKDFVEKQHRLKFITLTYGIVKEFNADILTDCRKKANKLLKDRYNGGLYAFELKKKENGVYVHLHALVVGKYHKQKELSEQWEKITGKSIVDIREVRRDNKTKINGSYVNAIHYILKYITKMDDTFNTSDKIKLYHSLYKKRFVQSFGSFYNVKTDKNDDFLYCDCGYKYEFFSNSPRLDEFSSHLFLWSLKKNKGDIT